MMLKHSMIVCQTAARGLTVRVACGNLLQLDDWVVDHVQADRADWISVAEGCVVGHHSVGRVWGASLRVVRGICCIGMVLAPEGTPFRVCYGRLIEDTLCDSFILSLTLLKHRLQLLDLTVFFGQNRDEVLRIELNCPIWGQNIERLRWFFIHGIVACFEVTILLLLKSIRL